MAISKARASSIATFARYNDALAGNVPGSGEFILCQNSSTGAYSADGVTWTTFTWTGSSGYNTVQQIVYNSTTQLWVAWDNGGLWLFPRRSQLATPGVIWGSGAQPSGQNANYKVFGPSEYWGGGSGDSWAQINGRHTMGYVTRNTSLTNKYMSALAWDGANTWAIGAQNSHWYYTVNSNGSQYPPANTNYGSPWTTFTGPSGVTGTQFRDICFFNGAWHVSSTNGVWRSVSLASPSWTQTLSYVTAQQYIAGGSLWQLGFTNSVSTIYSTTDGTTYNTITLPSSKARQGIAYGNGIYVIANTDGTVTTSVTGASGTWTDRSTGLTGSANASTIIAFGAN